MFGPIGLCRPPCYCEEPLAPTQADRFPVIPLGNGNLEELVLFPARFDEIVEN